MTAPKDRERWHIDKGIPLALILSLIVAITAGWYDNKTAVALQGQRIDNLENQVSHHFESQAELDRAQDVSLTGFRDEMRGLVNRVDDKLDRLLELYITGNR